MSRAKQESNKVELLTVVEVAEVLACSRRQVFRLRAAGRLPAPVRIGGLIRWSRPALDEWIRGGCAAPLASPNKPAKGPGGRKHG